MDTKLQLETLAFVLLIVAFPMISIGSDGDTTAVWVAGFVAVILGGLLPVATRFMDHSDDEIRDMGMEFDERTS